MENEATLAQTPTKVLTSAMTIEEDPEKKKKKEEKAKEKEAKKAKAAAKAAAMASSKAAQKEGSATKKQEKSKKPSLNSELKADTQSEDNPPTPVGQKKLLSPEMAKSYNPRAVESSWYEWWEQSGFFSGDNTSNKPPFVMVVPPPNVTGALHIGHALTTSIQDTICRWRRMSGYNVCWVPGVDHAGIATQVVVEKKLMKERNITRHDLGREAFVDEVWKWKNEYGNRICSQLRKMGASLDWSRECFTMDPKLSAAVVEAFVQLFNRGLIYRDNRLVNWDCTLKTAISDIEVEYKELAGRTPLRVPGYSEPVDFGIITSFAYPLEDGSGEIVVATTRLETMLGDTAVAVHPEDQRYLALHGKRVRHPFSGRLLPIICDAELVKMEFGTGAVKITPAHDPNDFATGKRHNLDFICVFTDEGLINGHGGPEFEGLQRFVCRQKLVERLQEMGLYRGVADNPMSLGFCSRSNEVIEPMIKPQWYVSCSQAAASGIQAVQDGRLEIIPDIHKATWNRWLSDIRDWCISRQLWWGHRVPAWYVVLEADTVKELGAYENRWIAARSPAEAEQLAAQKFPASGIAKLIQDPDVLDTWFSSGLFPFSVFGWPTPSADLKTFYPTALLETGHDILFFWVARMVMLGITLTDDVPFKQVYLHAMVRDAHGRKMSKSLGNVIDPLEVIHGVSLEELQKKLEAGNLDPREVEKAKEGQRQDFPVGIAECGCDALRFALVAYTAQSVNINLDIQRVVGYRLWCNKLWNATRFAMINLGPSFTPTPISTLDYAALPLSCRWILSVLNSTIKATVAAMEAYDFSTASSAVYAWWQYHLCDVFIEVVKPVLNPTAESGETEELLNNRQIVRTVLWLCLDTGLRLLHPFMPFVTEELWQRLPNAEGEELSSIMLAEYPKAVQEWEHPEAESAMEYVEAAVKCIRALRVSYGLQKHQKPQVILQSRSVTVQSLVQSASPEIATLASLSSVKVVDGSAESPSGCAISIVNDNITVYLLLAGLVDVESEIAKLKRKQEETAKAKALLEKKIQVPGYETKVPQKVQEENAAKGEKLRSELESILEAISNFENLKIQSGSE